MDNLERLLRLYPPIYVYCHNCNKSYKYDNEFICPHCKSKRSGGE